MFDNFFINAKKPEGFGGKLMTKRMNRGHHAVLAEWGLSFSDIPDGARMLDCGCGGGANLRRLLKRVDGGKVCGIDYSEVSIKQSLKTNRTAVRCGICKLKRADVAKLPLKSDYFDFVSAFETVYFWQEIEKAFSEIYRVLKAGGSFLVCNESDGRDDAALNISKVIDGMKLYTPEALEALMKNAGFEKTQIYTNPEKHHITVIGYKK